MKSFAYWKYICVLTITFIVAIAVSCTRNLSVPVTAIVNTPTATTNAPVNTSTNTPVPGAPTNTFTPTPTITNTPTATNTQAATPLVVFANGTMATLGSVANGQACNAFCFFADSGGDYPTGLNETNSGGYGSDTASFAVSWTGSVASYSGITWVAPGSTNMSAFTTCTFYAETTQASGTSSVNFNAATPSGDNNIVTETIGTSWSLQTITITIGSRSDGYSGGSLNPISSYFVISQGATTTQTFPLQVNVDQMQFQ